MASGTIKAVVSKSDIANNLTTTDAGKVLDARQGKVLRDLIIKDPVTYTSYADVKSGIQSKASSMASGSFASFDFRANYSTAEKLPAAYYTCIIRKYDNNSYVADIISNTGLDYKLSYSGNTWRMVALSDQLTLRNIDITAGPKVNSLISTRKLMGKLCILSGYMSLDGNLVSGDVIATLSNIPASDIYARFAFFKNDGSGTMFFGKFNSSNQIVFDGGTSSTASGQYYVFNFSFFAV